jgi:hypothetical protein
MDTVSYQIVVGGEVEAADDDLATATAGEVCQEEVSELSIEELEEIFRGLN